MAMPRNNNEAAHRLLTFSSTLPSIYDDWLPFSPASLRLTFAAAATSLASYRAAFIIVENTCSTTTLYIYNRNVAQRSWFQKYFFFMKMGEKQNKKDKQQLPCIPVLALSSTHIGREEKTSVCNVAF